MRYSHEYKLECIELYRQGIWPETPERIKTARFRKMIRYWVRIEEQNGPDALKHLGSNKVWTPEAKYELVAKVLAGQSNKSVAISAGISDGMLYTWVRKYKELGYNGLVNKQKGRKSNNPDMKKKTIEPKPLTESEREELIRLRAEIAAMKAEIEVVKKRIALRQERWAAQLKAKKAAIIKALREEGYQLKYLLKGLNMPKSTYYYEISKVDTVGFRNAELTEEIKKIFDQHKGRYGVRECIESS